jgi:hypothetical protein
MQRRFIDWKDAHTHAQTVANLTRNNVAIRKVKEFGKTGFNVSFASTDDSDYANAEIVKPDAIR